MLNLADDNAIRKAAVLMRSLDGDAAAAVLERLSADEARALRDAVRQLGEVSDDDRRRVAKALREPTPPTAPGPPPNETMGVELAISGATTTAAERLTENATPADSAADSTPRDSVVDALTDADTDTLARHLRDEQPQTVAAAMLCIAPEQAAAVLATLPDDRRPLVLDRLADLGDADPESLQVITSGLREEIAEQQRRHARRTQRLGAIGAILSASSGDDRRRLLEAIDNRSWRRELPDTFGDTSDEPVIAPPEPPVDGPSETQPEPRLDSPANRDEPVALDDHLDGPAEPQEPPPPLVTFADVERLPAAALAQVLRHTPAEHLLLALVGGSEALLGKITATLPRRQAAALRKQLTKIGPTRLRDIELAQGAVAQTASELLRRGWVPLTTAAR